MLPDRDALFFGRQSVLDEIDKHLIVQPQQSPPDIERSNDLISFVITGMGGMGKTSVAREYAYS
jgi:hypothetical protein